MKVSIALCTYNGERCLLEQLKSIASQTRRPDELVVCDDHSTDNTLKILYSFKETCPFPMRIYENATNLGSTKNFEQAIRLCHSDIIALSDQDDVWKPQKIETILSVLMRNPTAGYVFSDAEVVDENLNSLGYRLWESYNFNSVSFELFTKGEQLVSFMRGRFVTGATMAFRSSLRNIILPIPTDTIWIHDGWIAVVSSAAGAYGIPLPDTLILYRRHGLQQIGAEPPNTTDKSLLGQYRAFKKDEKRIARDLEHQIPSFLYLKARLAGLDDKNSYIIRAVNLIDQRVEHYDNRIKIQSARGLSKLNIIYKEISSGRYGLFAESWKSILRDLVL